MYSICSALLLFSEKLHFLNYATFKYEAVVDILIVYTEPKHVCACLSRDLSFNHLTRLEETAFVGLGLLESLNLGENSISHLGEGVFSGLASLRTL